MGRPYRVLRNVHRLIQCFNTHQVHFLCKPFNFTSAPNSSQEPKNGNFIEEGYVSLVFLCKGIIHYSTYDPNIDLLTTIHSESYNEALSIVQDHKNLNTIPSAKGL